MQPTIHDVARLANTSKSTVSRYLNGQKVKKHTALALEQAIRELNFHRNMNARRLVMNKTFTIGVIVDNISNTFYSGLIRGIEQMVHRSGYNSVFYSWDSTLTDHPREEEKRESTFLKLLHEGQVDGLIMLSFCKRSLEELQRIADTPYPVVLIGDDGQQEQLLSVDVDHEAGIDDTVQYLYDLGHRRISYISGPSYITASTYRFQGYVQALQQRGIDYDEKLVISSDWSKEGGYTAMQHLLKRSSFTAVIGSNDEVAVGAMRAAVEAGLHVPTDMSIAGYDDIPISAWIMPGLTTVRQPLEQVGQYAADLLFSKINESVSSSRRFRPKLIVRSSCESV
ncbi:LacI family DNA-binding transcriptional regulator [Paenibacillus kandeliae]|uniref:LacI family DNA-binding transcriptional regulator n=1 Tax=Paenibacillus kandeliae TaxID=3231269 RepID=UPI003457DB4C